MLSVRLSHIIADRGVTEANSTAGLAVRQHETPVCYSQGIQNREPSELIKVLTSKCMLAGKGSCRLEGRLIGRHAAEHSISIA